MVSFWPWRSEDSSPEGFEKALSALATKVADAQAHLDSTRSQSRRVRVLSSLYLGFAYAVYAVVIMLVVGYQKMELWEWAGMVGGPVVIITTRRAIRSLYDYRIDALEKRVLHYQEERARTIQKLKDATKYDSTLQLLQKYGELDRKPPSEHDGERRDHSRERPRTRAPSLNGPQRTGLPPPPTANIQRPPSATTPQSSRPTSSSGPGQDFYHGHHQQHPAALAAHLHPPPLVPQLHVHEPAADPLVVAAAVEPRQFEPAAPHWYDRILDLLMGEDETSAKNRIVLICWKCRLVNGQAPPGTKRLSDLGHWRCKECKAMNGEVDEGKKIVSEVLKAGGAGGVGVRREAARKEAIRQEAARKKSASDEAGADADSDMVQVAKEDVAGVDEDEGAATGGDAKGSGKGDAVRKRKGKSKN
jgi:hypothetical protein